MFSRKNTEKHYHKLFKSTSNNQSFTYATIVGFNYMDSVLEFPGFTYYFKLNNKQIENTIFEVVDKKYNLQPKLGLNGLSNALEFWISNIGKFSEYHDDVVGGIIKPRIEVVIPFDVKYFDFVPQIENR